MKEVVDSGHCCRNNSKILQFASTVWTCTTKTTKNCSGGGVVSGDTCLGLYRQNKADVLGMSEVVGVRKQITGIPLGLTSHQRASGHRLAFLAPPPPLHFSTGHGVRTLAHKISASDSHTNPDQERPLLAK